jgi:Pyruvate/2-oxoacid:ferredoxin oxidoreductase gamma subunit/Pyruvate/2-oxoacid:ferredoxin oxidoreductase delta subunit
VLAFQSLAGLFLRDPQIHVQEWPFFSSARRGANIRSFLRVSARPITAACELTRPALVLLMDEAAAHAVDFAQGVPPGGTFVINTRRSPEECAKHFKLSGRVMTIAGDDLGMKYVKHAIGNISAYVAMSEAVGGFARQDVIDGFLGVLRKRRIPEAVVLRNQQTLEASFDAIKTGTFDFAGPKDHGALAFAGYGDLPVGAQTRLRLSETNRTANFAPSGFRLKFIDPNSACTGCAHCITNCPEGIINFVPDATTGLKVTGADVNQFCKLCQECVAVCPEKLFVSAPFEEHWQEEEARVS